MKHVFILLLFSNTLKSDICPKPDGCNPCSRERFYINPVLSEENTKLFCCPENENCICLDLIS
ncbi:MAG: hypothetical protein P4L22_00330 [Candidatus Babeliales bacterium]|nr:hypothetical protein [Candidatus Babeliales bacterium]